MRLLVTRPSADAAALADALKAAGHEVLLEPIIEIRERPDSALDLDGVTGLLFTSANGVRAFAATSPRRDISAYAVGDHTTATAKEAGFSAVESADGDVDALIRLVRGRRKPEDGTLLHVSGTVTAGALTETLSEAGYTVRQAALYEAETAEALSESTRTVIADGELDGVLLFSPRTAKQFAALVDHAGLGAEARLMNAWCLSQAVADALAPLAFRKVVVAAKPTTEALLALIGPNTASASAAPAIESAPIVRQRRSTLPALAALTVLIILAGIGWWAYSRFAGKSTSVETASSEAPSEPTVSPSPGPTPEAAPRPTAALETVGPRLDRLEEKLDQTAPKDAIAALGQRLSALEARPETASAAEAPNDQGPSAEEAQRLSSDLGQLTQRVAALEARFNQRLEAARSEEALVLAAAQIRTALAGSGPFEAPVAMLRAAAPDDKLIAVPLATLAAYAKTGVASRTVLAQQLAALPDHLNDPVPPAEGAGFWDRVEGRLGTLVRVRKIDDRPGDGTAPAGADRLIADAEADLTAGDLDGAVKAIQGLRDRAGAAAKPWLEAAGARLDCEQAAAALETELTRRLSSGTAAK